MKKITVLFVLTTALLLALVSCGHVHAFGEWTTTKEATCTKQGLKERVCECGEKETQTIDELSCSYNTNSEQLKTYNGIKITELEYFSNGITIVSVNAKTSYSIEFIVRNDSGKAINEYTSFEYMVLSSAGIVQNTGNMYLDALDPGESCYASVSINSSTATLKFGAADVRDGSTFFVGDMQIVAGINMNALPYTSNGITIVSVNAKNSTTFEFIVRNDTGKAISEYTSFEYKVLSSAGIVQNTGNMYLDALDPGESCYASVSINSSTATIKFGEADVRSGRSMTKSITPNEKVATVPVIQNVVCDNTSKIVSIGYRKEEI